MYIVRLIVRGFNPMQDTQRRFDGRFYFRAPAKLRTAIDRAAMRSLTTPSNYVRTALAAQLNRDGVEIEFSAATEAA
jgi:hypothetical protein